MRGAGFPEKRKKVHDPLKGIYTWHSKVIKKHKKVPVKGCDCDRCSNARKLERLHGLPI